MQHIALTLACLVALTSALPTSHHNHTADDLHDDLHDNIHLNETERELADSNSTALEMDNGHGELNGTDDGHHGHGHDHPHSHDDVPEHFEGTTTNVMISAVQTGEVNANGTETKTKHSHHCRHHNHDGNKENVDGSEDDSEDSTSVDDDNKSDESTDVDGDINEKDSETDSDEDDCKEESDSKDNSDGAEEEKASESDESGEYSDERSIDYSDNRSGSSLTSAEKDEKRKQYLNEGIEEFDRDIKKFLDSIGQGDLYHQLSSASTISSFTTLTLLAFMASLLV